MMEHRVDEELFTPTMFPPYFFFGKFISGTGRYDVSA